MSLEFGTKVFEKAKELTSQGIDANQSAKVLFDMDDAGYNYGIGIVLDEKGNPMATSATLLEYARKEVDGSGEGNYYNSNKQLGKLKEAVLSWQKVPQKHWDNFKLALPSDAGTGAVQTAIDLSLILNPQIKKLGIEEFGWPAYKAMAKNCRIGVQEYPADAVIKGEDTLSLYQAGPMNTTGFVTGPKVKQARAQAAAGKNYMLVLDRAYSGFEFASELSKIGYDKVMEKSYELQLAPFIEAGVKFSIAISPTKCFLSFALRPCGLLLVYCPDKKDDKQLQTSLNLVIRARGSSFEHAITRAFVKAMINDRSKLEAEHKGALERVAKAESIWRKFVKGTPIEYLYSPEYAGLFRNPKAKENAQVQLYNDHIYPVFAESRCRQNVTGIPSDEKVAAGHVKAFAEQCY